MSSLEPHNTAVTSFNANHASYDQLRPSFDDKIVNAFLSNLGLKDNDKYRTDKKILELASGTGKFTKCLVERGWEHGNIEVVEPSSGMLDTFRKNFPKVKAKLGSSYEIPAEDSSIDAVVVAQGFHWFSDLDSLKEINRVLKKDGYFGCIWNYDCPTIGQTLLNLDAKINYIFEGPEKSHFDSLVRVKPRSLNKPLEISNEFFEQSPWAIAVAEHVYSYDIKVPQYRRAVWRKLLNSSEAASLFTPILDENFLLFMTTTTPDDVFKLWETRSYITELSNEKKEELRLKINDILSKTVRESDKINDNESTLLKKALGTHTITTRALK
ncbi:hypothetical protein CAAN1_11S03158 [[Candida] anglica]|uniref:Methyltransferase type 11 domain-containing protein n=1 Tax=[Candida] anglica TaxID=148631 RepID=A0ABP0ELJ0_9ASCO